MIARLSALAAAALLAVACSSAVEGTGSSDDALLARGDCSGDGINSGVICTGGAVGPIRIESATEAPASGYNDTCGSDRVAVPVALRGYGCTLGMMVDNQPIWACPDTIPTVPTTLGQVAVTEGSCVDANGNWRDDVTAGGSCEWVTVIDGIGYTLRSNCVGNPSTGWILIVDSVLKVDSSAPYVLRPHCHWTGTTWHCGPTQEPGPCGGNCALTTPPLAN